MQQQTQPPQPVRVILADDQVILHQAVTLALGTFGGIDVVAAAISPHEALQLASEHRPDVLIHELTFPEGSGLELIRNVKAARLPTWCLAYTRQTAASYAEQCLRAGGRGFVSKTEPAESLYDAVRLVASGGIYISQRNTGLLLQQLAAGTQDDNAPLSRLSTNEFEVLQRIGRGMSNRQIAEALHRSIKTVETYRARLKTKLRLENSVQLAQFAVIHLKEV